MKADCHCHTLHSDGSLTPEAILDLAKEKNLDGLSITDHDTIDAYSQALPYAQKIGIKLISGIEISTEFMRSSVHVLGYAFDLNNAALINFCHQQKQERTQRNVQILEKLAKRKFFLDLDEIQARSPKSTIGRPHIAQFLVEKGYVSSVKKAFNRYLGDKASCFVRGFSSTVEEAISLIKEAGGFAVLAHPLKISAQKNLPALFEMPFDGIEVYHGYTTKTDADKLLAVAQKQSLLITGGSDFHGGSRPYPTLGMAFTPHETYDLFEKRFSSHPNNII